MPEPGGLFAQNYRLIRQMTACANVYQAHSNYKAALITGNTARWADDNPDAWALICEMENERRVNG